MSDNSYGVKMDLIRETYLSFISGMLASPLPVVTVIFLANFLTTKQLGAYFFITASVMVTRRPIDGLVNTMRKRGVETGAKVRQYLGFSAIFSMLYVTVVSLVFTSLSDYIGSAVFITSEQVLAGVVVLLGLTVLIFGVRLQDTIGEPSVGGWILTSRDYIFIPIAIFMNIVFDIQTAVDFLYIYAAVSFSLGVLGIMRAGVVPRFPRPIVRYQSFSFARWEVPNVISRDIISKAPTIVTGLSIGGIAVGLFESGAQLSMFVPFLAVAVSDPAMLKISGKHSERIPIDNIISSTIGATALSPIIFLTIFASIGLPIVNILFTERQSTIWIIGLILGFARLSQSIRTVLSGSLRGADKPEKVFSVLALGSVLSLILLPTGAFLFDELGVATAFLALQILITAALAYRVKKEFSVVSIWSPLLQNQVFSSVAVFLTLFYINFRFNIETAQEIIAVCVLGFLAFILLLLIIDAKSRIAAKEITEITIELLE
jgi:O-antigen/teichoic acid export membrane protein